MRKVTHVWMKPYIEYLVSRKVMMSCLVVYNTTSATVFGVLTSVHEFLLRFQCCCPSRSSGYALICRKVLATLEKLSRCMFVQSMSAGSSLWLLWRHIFQ